jgi:predicted acetyltransferase
MGIEIRPVEHARADAYLRAVWRGFHDPTVEQADLDYRRERWLEGRWWAAIDGDDIVATVRTLPLDTTLPGGAQPTSCGITAVTTASTHRRRGLMSEMMVGALRFAHEAGEPLSTLIAAEWPIYGRFGYGPATEQASYTVRVPTQWRVDGPGTVELVEPEALLAVAPDVYDRHRANSPSEIHRDEWVWRMMILGPPSKPRKGFQAVCRDSDGVASGYVQYTIDENKFDGHHPAGVLNVEELIAVEPEAEACLWRYVCSVDWIRTVKTASRRVNELLPWLLVDARDLRQTERADFVWARPLDVATCLAARTYASPVGLVLEVVDPLGLSNGRFRVDSDGGVGTCAVTTATPDLTLPVATLGSMLFGGYSLPTLAAAGLVDEHSVGSLVAADSAFRSTTTPWSATWF